MWDSFAVDITNPQTWNRYAYVDNMPCNLLDPMGLDTCTLNVQFVNSANLTSDQVNAIESRIQQLYSSATGSNGDSVAVSFGSQGSPNATLTVENSSWWLPQSVFGTQGRLFGSPSVYWDNVSAYNPVNPTSFAGSVGAHELAHQFLATFDWWGSSDEAYNAKNPNMMMFDSAPAQAEEAAIINPDSALWQFTPDQVEAIYKKCKKYNRGGGGGNGGAFTDPSPSGLNGWNALWNPGGWGGQGLPSQGGGPSPFCLFGCE
jgi:hypothetical protein